MLAYCDTSTLESWRATKAHRSDVARELARIRAGVPDQWHRAMLHLGTMRRDAPEWLSAVEALDTLRDFEQAHGDAVRWNLSDSDVCAMADKLAGEAAELDAIEQGQGRTVPERFDTLRMLANMAGVEPLAIMAESSIKRMTCSRWWRRSLRVKVARVVEAGAIRLGVVNARAGGYASNAAVTRRAAQCERNAAALARTLYRNEAGQVFTLADLAAGSVSNPAIRGGELMTRIRGAEEYADAAGHVGLFVTLTCPSAMHAVKRGSGGRPQPNEKYDGHATPRTSQLWLRTQWARARAALHRQGIKMYGLRVAEPHHDATPHWHSLLWFETVAAAALAEGIIRAQWLAEYGNEKGAAVNRVNVKRLTAGGAAGYVAKYVAKSVGHHAIGESLDTVQGELLTVQAGDVPGHRRVDAWAATWGIRQFQFLGLPPVTVWRELRRVTSDQAQAARIAGDATVWKCWAASGARYLSGLNGLACWRTFMHGMGGHCQGRGRWALRTVRRAEQGKVNEYGEAVAGPVVGVESARDPGRWLISRRMAWARVATGAAVDQSKASEPRSGSPWTGFNNCTARLTGKLRAALIGLKHAGQCAAEVDGRHRWPGERVFVGVVV